MNCCQNNSSNQKIEAKSSRFLDARGAEAQRHSEIEEKKKVSWKTAIVALIILGLLLASSLGLIIH